MCAAVNEAGKPRAGDALGADPTPALSANRWPVPGSKVTDQPPLLP